MASEQHFLRFIVTSPPADGDVILTQLQAITRIEQESVAHGIMLMIEKGGDMKRNYFMAKKKYIKRVCEEIYALEQLLNENNMQLQLAEQGEAADYCDQEEQSDSSAETDSESDEESTSGTDNF